MPNAGAKKKPSVIRDKVVWKEKVHFDCPRPLIILSEGGPERSCTQNSIFCKRKEECYDGVQQDQVSKSQSKVFYDELVNLGLV